MRAALDLGIDYMDCHLSSPAKWAALRSFEGAIVKKGLCFITDGGFHPGVPAAMVRAAAKHMNIETADIYSSFNIDWAALTFGKNAAEDFVSELRDMDPSILVSSKWKRSWNNTSRHDFGEPYGVQKCTAMNFEEMKSLPALFPSLRDTGFYISGFGYLIDYFVLPVCMAALWLFPRKFHAVGNLFFWALKHWTAHGQWVMIDLDGAGMKDGKQASVKMRVFHKDPYDLTALPIVCCLEQYQSAPKRPGLWAQALYVEPNAFFKALRDKGAEITSSFPI
jgi:saccharopine dehydrogenase (NAD+, L-lysine-forming)